MSVSASNMSVPGPYPTAPVDSVSGKQSAGLDRKLSARDVGPVSFALRNIAYDWKNILCYLELPIGLQKIVESDCYHSNPVESLIRVINAFVEHNNEKPTLGVLTEKIKRNNGIFQSLMAFDRKIKDNLVFFTFTKPGETEVNALRRFCCQKGLSSHINKWFEIGAGLGLTVTELDGIVLNTAPRCSSNEYMHQALRSWLDYEGSCACWEQLEHVLNELSIHDRHIEQYRQEYRVFLTAQAVTSLSPSEAQDTESLKTTQEEKPPRESAVTPVPRPLLQKEWFMRQQALTRQQALMRQQLFAQHQMRTQQRINMQHPMHIQQMHMQQLAKPGVIIGTAARPRNPNHPAVSNAATAPSATTNKTYIPKPKMADLDNLKDKFPVSDWIQIGQQLGFDKSYLDNLMTTSLPDASARMMVMFQRWLEADADVSYLKLAHAVEKAAKSSVNYIHRENAAMYKTEILSYAKRGF